MPCDLAGGYERLRDAVRDPSRPLDGVAGLAIFVRQGMAAWMAACASVAPATIDSIFARMLFKKLVPLMEGLRASG